MLHSFYHATNYSIPPERWQELRFIFHQLCSVFQRRQVQAHASCSSMGGVALQAPAALWQLCGFHRDRLAPAALCRVVSPGEERLCASCSCCSSATVASLGGSSTCCRPASLTSDLWLPAALATLWLHRAGRRRTFGSCCSSVTLLALSSVGRWGSSVPAALWRLRGLQQASTTTCPSSCCSWATLWSLPSEGRLSSLALAALWQLRGFTRLWLLCASSSCCSSVTSWLHPAPGC